GGLEEYYSMVDELLTEGTDPRDVLAALLRLAFKNELTETSYPEVRRIDVDRRGKARLFIALGKADGYRPKMIVELLKKECGIPDQKIDDVRCLDDFSFASIPFQDAETAIKRLNSLHKGESDRPLVSLAKEEDQRSERPMGGDYGDRSSRGGDRDRGGDRGDRKKRY
ncbi:MAG: DbpA RNA binding domain-containing protein, partial [Mucinivorans sp.]